MPRGRKGYDHRDPVAEDAIEKIDEDRAREQVQKLLEDKPEAPWWKTGEVAKVLHKTPQTIRNQAVKIGLKTFVKGQLAKWSFTDVVLIRKAMEKAQPAKRDPRQKMIELQRMLDANDRGEL